MECTWSRLNVHCWNRAIKNVSGLTLQWVAIFMLYQILSVTFCQNEHHLLGDPQVSQVGSSVFQRKAFTLQPARTCRHCACGEGGCWPRGAALGFLSLWQLTFCRGLLSKCCLDVNLISVWGPMHFQLQVLCLEPVCCSLLWKHLSESRSKALEGFWSHYWWQGWD